MRPFDSKRIRFRELRVSDADGLHSGAFGIPEMTKHLQWDFHDTPEQTKELIEEMLELHRREEKYYWVAQQKPDDCLIGLGSLKPSDNTVWIGFLVMLTEHRKGYGSEIVSALEDVSFRHHESSSAAVAPSNEPSINLLRQAGWTEYEDSSQEVLKTYRKYSANPKDRFGR